MTKQDDGVKALTDRPALANEVTEEMVCEGINVLAAYDRDFDGDHVIVREIFKSMLETARLSGVTISVAPDREHRRIP
jgi:hypothetical protein